MENVGRETFPSRVAYLSSAGPLRNPKLITLLASKPGTGSRFLESFENQRPSCFGSFLRPYLVDTQTPPRDVPLSIALTPAGAGSQSVQNRSVATAGRRP